MGGDQSGTAELSLNDLQAMSESRGREDEEPHPAAARAAVDHVDPLAATTLVDELLARAVQAVQKRDKKLLQGYRELQLTLPLNGVETAIGRAAIAPQARP